MNSEENYLNGLLKSLNPDNADADAGTEKIESMDSTEKSTDGQMLVSEPVMQEELNLDAINLDSIDLESIEIPEAPDIELSDLDIDLGSEFSEPVILDEPVPETDDGFKLEDIEIPDAPELPEPLPDEESLIAEMAALEENIALEENMELPEEGMAMPDLDDEFKLEDIEIPDLMDMTGGGASFGDDLSIEGLEEAIQSETELEMAGELNTDELNIDELDFGEMSSNTGDSGKMPADAGGIIGNDGDTDMDDDSLDDVLNMLDDDAELAEINDMLKKSDSKEPIQDDMMDILNQMADEEEASVNAGVKDIDDEDDGGVPLPEIPKSVLDPDRAAGSEEEEGGRKKKGKKESKKKKKSDKEAGKAVEGTKEPGKMGKLFSMLTEELVPEPTEEELAAEKEAKAAKKQEELTKKEEQKLAKEEEKKAKAEEKAAADKAKKEAAAQKKKEKQAAKEAKRAKAAAAAGPKKRIPPKKMAAAALFGATVGGAVILSTNILSTQGYIHTARNAYYDQDYMTVYQATFGMELDDSKDIGLIQARSEVLLKLQRRYDSYQNYTKLGLEKEALDALLQGVATYDFINADAEKYEVSAEFETVKANILNTLSEKYNVDEARARELANTQDALSYTMALEDIIAGK